MPFQDRYLDTEGNLVFRPTAGKTFVHFACKCAHCGLPWKYTQKKQGRKNLSSAGE
jgi:hypothetical protein